VRALLTLALLLLLAAPVPARNSQKNKLAARSQFEAAERMKEALNGRPADQRTRKDYRRVIEAYRRVYYTAPTSRKADASVLAVAELLAESGRSLGDDKLTRAAIQQYEFLRREYPGSKYRFQALLAIGQIYHEDLDDAAGARAVFNEFLKRYPRHRLAEQARDTLAEMDAKARPGQSSGNGRKSQEGTRAGHGGGHKLLLLTGIRHWSTPDYTRIAIDLEDEVKYEAGRVPRPNRIFFDLHDTKLASELLGKTFKVEDGFVQRMRVAQYTATRTRLVLEVTDTSQYSAVLLPNPYRLIIDIHAKPSSAKAADHNPIPQDGTKADSQPLPQGGTKSGSLGTPASHPSEPKSGSLGTPASAAEENKDSGVRQANEKSKSAATPAPEASSTRRASAPDSGAPQRPEPSVAPGQSPSALGRRAQGALARNSQAAATKASARQTVSATHDSNQAAEKTADESQKTALAGVVAAPANSPSERAAKSTLESVGPRPDKAKLEIASALPPRPAANRPEVPSSRPRGASTQDGATGRTREAGRKATREARPTSSGDRSLIRVLGLKIGRIVVDPGHGGHDTGSIGPHGLREKDLALDVALHLGKLLEDRLGAEVIYTREHDTYVPLEARTALANKTQADLFISIHANSSRDPAARGTETYYLNFTSSPESLEVAARENAASEKSVFELQDLVKRIALKEKIEESREFATNVEKALHAGLARKTTGLRERGVKKAPFVVLIGANMPSILAEISFISNPSDERRLQSPEYRQKIAESLYRGVARYADGLSGVKVAAKLPEK